MQTSNHMIVNSLELLDSEDDGIDRGLVLVTAESLNDDAATMVEFLANVSDGWWIGRTVRVTVEWEPTEGEEEDHPTGTLELNRGLAAHDLDPSQFTQESVADAPITED